MTDPYSTFDTFSVGSEPELTKSVPASTPPIIARLPKIPAARPTVRKRFDEAESPLPEAHLNESASEASGTGSPTSLGYGSFTTTSVGDTIATIRIDTVSPDLVHDGSTTTLQKNSSESIPATIPFQPVNDPPVVAESPAPQSLGQPWTAWMLDIESTIQPYARWIALAAVIAAMGLTVVLLRGSGGAVETINTTPQVLNDSQPSQALAGDYETGGAPPYWPASVTKDSRDSASVGIEATYADQGLRPLDNPATATAPPLVASGPASAARASATARLTGEVYHTEAPRIDVADAKYNTGTTGTIR